MAYDEHGESSKPGPIASMSWYRDVVQRALRSIPREKLVVGLANYAYDWMEGREWADPMTYQGALSCAQDYRQQEKPEDIVDFDDDALNPTFWYVDDDGKEHEVWMLDAVTAANQWLIASELRRPRRGGLGPRIDRSVDLDVPRPRQAQSSAEHERARPGEVPVRRRIRRRRRDLARRTHCRPTARARSKSIRRPDWSLDESTTRSRRRSSSHAAATSRR